MTRRAEHPTRVAGKSPVAETRETHPAYGQLRFSRTTGDPGVLYGSHLDRHMGSICMTLSQSERLHGLSQDWHFATRCLVEVDLSYVQFAELLTTMNAGDGVPCTIRKLPDNWDIPEIAHSETEQKRVQSDFKDRIEKFSQEARASMSEVEAVLSKPSIGKADRESIRGHFNKWIRMIEDSAPFVLDQFQESVERTAAAAKSEVDGFLTSAVASAGLSALRERLSSGLDGTRAELAAGEKGCRREHVHGVLCCGGGHNGERVRCLLPDGHDDDHRYPGEPCEWGSSDES